MNWDQYFLRMTEVAASKSKDRSTKVGCVIVGPDHDVRSTGFNGFPRRVNDEVEDRHARPAKYLWTEHAERNAIFAAAKVGTPLSGCTAYLQWFPCADCARAMIQVGIVAVVCLPCDEENERWGESFRTAKQMLIEAGMQLRFIGSDQEGRE